MSLAADILEASRRITMHGSRPHILYVNQRDHENIVDTFEYGDAVDGIEFANRATGGTYQQLTTRLGQLAVARRIAGRRGQRFRALTWLRDQSLSHERYDGVRT